MDFQEQTKLYLKEGVEYYKYSKKFTKLAKEMEENLQYATTDREEIIDLIEQLKQAASDFKEAEEEYKSSRYTGMARYKVLKMQYKDLIKIAKKDTVKKFLLTVGGLGLLGNVINFLEKN